MIKVRSHSDERDQARAVVEFLEQHGKHIIQNAPRIAVEDKNLLESTHAQLGSDFAQLSQLLGLTLNDAASAVAHELITKVMIGSWMTGVGASFSPEAKKWGDLVKGRKANQGGVDKAQPKNERLRRAIVNEAEALGLKLAVSAKCARVLQPGVCRRCGVDIEAEGYSWATIRTQITAILAK